MIGFSCNAIFNFHFILDSRRNSFGSALVSSVRAENSGGNVRIGKEKDGKTEIEGKAQRTTAEKCGKETEDEGETQRSLLKGNGSQGICEKD